MEDQETKQHTPALDAGGTSDLIDWLADFDLNWRPNSVLSHLAGLPESLAAGRVEALAELVKIDLLHTWRSGMDPPLEDYLRQFPELSGSPEMLADLIAAELEARRLVGKPDLEQAYAARFPQQADMVRQRLAANCVSGSPRSARSTESFHPSGDLPAADSRWIAGKYRLLQQIGEGGMGVVYLAEQTVPIRRKVALKLVKAGRDSKQILARFSVEQQAIAMMDHPNIAKCFDAGTTDRNEPYFVMELIHGKPITAYCDENCLTPEERIALLIPVCQAIQHAHHKGIIHRDIKSSNILVAQYDSRPVAKVIDFGLAKAVGQQLTDHSSPTLFGMVVGTLGYMSPEQATSNQLDVDARTDIYSLAAVLYELLTGSTPHASSELRSRAVDEVLRVIREDDPILASRRVSSSDALPSLAATRKTNPRRLVGLLKDELDFVVMKALDRERHRRYQHASEFAEDLQRFLDREPVHAAAPSFAYRVTKWLRRNWKAAAVAASLLVTALAGAAGVAVQEYRRFEATRAAENSRLRAESERKSRELADARADATQRQSDLARVRAEAAVREAASGEYVGILGKLSREENLRSQGWAERSWELLQRAVTLQTPLRNDAELRTAAANVLLADEYRAEPDWTIEGKFTSVAYAPSGNVLAVTPYADYLHPNPQVFLLDAATGKQRSSLSIADNRPSLEALKRHTLHALKSRFDSCRFLESDQSLVAGSLYGRVVRWDLSQDPPKALHHSVGNASARILVTPDQRWIVARAWGSSQFHCFDAKTFQLAGGPVDCPLRSESVVVVGNDSILIDGEKSPRYLSLPDFQDRTTEKPLPAGLLHRSGTFFAEFDGETFRATTWPDNIKGHRYDLPLDNKINTSRAERSVSVAAPASVKFTTSGQLLCAAMTAERGDEVRVWDAWGGPLRAKFSFPAGAVLLWDGVYPSANAEHIALATRDFVTQYSRLRPLLTNYRVPGHPTGARFIRMAPDASELAILGERRKDGADVLYRRQTDSMSRQLHGQDVVSINSFPPNATEGISFSPDGTWLIVAGRNNPNGIGLLAINRRQADQGKEVAIPHVAGSSGSARVYADAISGLGWTSRGELVAAVDCDLQAWNLAVSPPAQIAREAPPRLLKDPHRYAAIAMPGTEVGWAVTVQSQLRSFQIQGAAVAITERWQVPGDGNSRSCRLNPSGRHLAIGKADGTVVLFDTRERQFTAPRTDGHDDAVQAIHWLDDRRLVTGSRDGWLAIWRVTDAGELSPEYRLDLKTPISDLSPTTSPSAIYVAGTDETSVRVIELGLIDRELAALFQNTTPSSVPDAIPLLPSPAVADRHQETLERVAVAASRAPKKEVEIQYSSEREAAEWILSIGGTVTVVSRDGTELPIENQELPAENFLVRDVVFDGCQGLTAAGLEKLTLCRAIYSLQFMNLPDLTDDQLAVLKSLDPRHLVLDRCLSLTDQATKHFVHLAKLETLQLQTGRFSDAAFANLPRLPRLLSLTVAEPAVTDAGFAVLAEKCPDIKSLDIARAGHPKLTAASIGQFGELTSVAIHGDQLTADAAEALNAVPQLQTLRISHSVTKEALRHLGKLASVTSLTLQANSVDDQTAILPEAYADATWPPKLLRLEIIGGKAAPRDADFLPWVGLSSLRSLRLACRQDSPNPPPYSRIGLNRLRRLRPDIEWVDEGGPDITQVDPAIEREVAEWVLSVGATLSVKDLQGKVLDLPPGELPSTPFTVDGVVLGETSKPEPRDLAKLVACHRLKSLFIVRYIPMTEEGLAALEGVSVHDLILQECPHINDRSIASLGKFHDLTTLCFRDLEVTDACIRGIGQQPTLDAVNVARTKITDIGLNELGELCPNIKHMFIERPSAGLQSVRGLAGYKNLVRIDISESQLTDEAVEVINRLDQVTNLQIATSVSDDSLRRIERLKRVVTMIVVPDSAEIASQQPENVYRDVSWPECLQHLYLTGNSVSPSDDDLMKLAGLPDFRVLCLGPVPNTTPAPRYTLAGMAKLRASRPMLVVHINGQEFKPGQPIADEK